MPPAVRLCALLAACILASAQASPALAHDTASPSTAVSAVVDEILALAAEHVGRDTFSGTLSALATAVTTPFFNQSMTDTLDEYIPMLLDSAIKSNAIELLVNGVPLPLPEANMTAQGVMYAMEQHGAGAILRLELGALPVDHPMQALASGLARKFGLPVTAHVYMNLANSSFTLGAHTDPYDVLVIQTLGGKNWTVRICAVL